MDIGNGAGAGVTGLNGAGAGATGCCTPVAGVAAQAGCVPVGIIGAGDVGATSVGIVTRLVGTTRPLVAIEGFVGMTGAGAIAGKDGASSAVVGRTGVAGGV